MKEWVAWLTMTWLIPLAPWRSIGPQQNSSSELGSGRNSSVGSTSFRTPRSRPQCSSSRSVSVSQLSSSLADSNPGPGGWCLKMASWVCGLSILISFLQFRYLLDFVLSCSKGPYLKFSLATWCLGCNVGTCWWRSGFSSDLILLFARFLIHRVRQILHLCWRSWSCF